MNSMNEAPDVSLNPWILSFLVLLPFVSAAASYMGFHDVLLIIFLLLGLFAFVAILRGDSNFDDRMVMILILSISLSLILSSTFASDYIRGYDINGEYRVALQTSVTGTWSPQYSDPYYSVLSVAILPAVISNLSALSVAQTFRFVYPAIFSLVPVILYRITRKILAPAAAFLSVFLFMSYEVFYDLILGAARQEIGEVILVLLILVLLSPAVGKGIAGRISLILLMVGFAVAHYSLVYILILILAYSCLTSRAFRKTEGPILLGLIVVAGFAWYTFSAGGAGNATLGHDISSIYGLLTNGPSSIMRTPVEVSRAVGSTSLSPGPLEEANRWTQIAVQLFLLLGFFVSVFKKKSVNEQKMFPLMTGGLILLVSSVALPGLGNTVGLDRMYHITLLFIAPFFVYGAERVELVLVSLGSRVRIPRYPLLRTATRGGTLHLAAAILFLYFLFVSGWLTVVSAGVPTSLVLDANRMRNSADPTVGQSYYDDFNVLPDITGAVWLRSYDVGNRPVCADITARAHVLEVYGEFPYVTRPFLQNYLPDNCHFSNSFVYLDEFNNLYGRGVTFQGTFPISDDSQALSKMNQIYSNGATTIYA